ncbi:hypothetical protein EDB83DRAFT_2396641 [Lactarius deliciosus]|nr:hypothetical protein EDB83DRAFT_2396641 [Lactarius deliciosus]
MVHWAASNIFNTTSPRRGLLPRRSTSNAQRKGLVPAIGSLSVHIKANPSLSGLPDLDLPPSPALPPPTTRNPPTRVCSALTDTRRRVAVSTCYALSS